MKEEGKIKKEVIKMVSKKIEIMIDGRKKNEFIIENTEDYSLPDIHAFVEHIKGWLFDELMKEGK